MSVSGDGGCGYSIGIGGSKVRVCVRDVLQHVVGVIEHGKLSKMWIASDYVHLLLNYVLNCNKYVYAMTPKEWNGEGFGATSVVLPCVLGLLDLVCRLYLSPSTNIDRIVLTKLLNVVLYRSTAQCDVNTFGLFKFYEEALQTLRYMLNRHNV